MNADIPPKKVYVPRQHIIADGTGFEEGVAFAVQSYRGRALQFHVLFKSGAHFRHVPVHFLWTSPLEEYKPQDIHDLEQLQLWDCFSFRPVVTCFDFLRDHQCVATLRNRETVQGVYWFTIDWLADSDDRSGWLSIPEQNKCAHVVLLANGQVAALPTNRVAFADAYYIGNDPRPGDRKYRTLDTVWQAEDSSRWSVADTDEHHY